MLAVFVWTFKDAVTLGWIGIICLFGVLIGLCNLVDNFKRSRRQKQKRAAEQKAEAEALCSWKSDTAAQETIHRPWRTR